MELNNVFEKGCLCNVTTRIWGNRHKIPKEYLDIGHAKKELLRGTHSLVDPESAEISALNTFRSRVVSFLEARSLPFPIRGVRFIPKQLLEEVDNGLREFDSELWRKVGELEDGIGYLIEQAKADLGDLFNPMNYPSNIRRKFGFEWNFYNINVSDAKASILSPEMYHREVQKLQNKIGEFERNIVFMLRMKFRELLDHMVDKLSGIEKKRFNSSLVEKPTEFLNSFRKLNIVGDSDLEAHIKQAELIVQGVDPQELRNDCSFRNGVADQLKVVESKLDEMIVDQVRFVDVDWDEDE